MFQTSTANAGTTVGIIPNGTSNASLLELYGSSTDQANTSYGRLALALSSAEFAIASNIRGTGTYLPMTFYTGGSERMRVDTSGNVGVGTSSPSYKLDVSATGNISGQFKTSGSINALYLADAGTTAGTLYIGTVGNDFRVVTGSNERMRIDSSGNVGIGTTSTGGYRVAIVGSTASSIPLYLNTDASNAYVYSPNSLYIGTTGANNAVFVTNNAEAMRITSGGIVGIGTNAPASAKLVISGSSIGNSNIRLINTAVGGRTWDICPFAVGINDGYFTIRDGTAGAERFTIESGGNVGIGVSTSANLASRLNVGNAALASFTGTTAGTMTLFDTSSTSDRFTTLDFTTSSQALPVARIGMKFTGAGSQFFFGTSTSYVSGVNVTAMTLDQSGNLVAAGNVTAYSDARLKKNVSTIDNALELVEKMRGVRYERIDSGKAGVGVIAQEMQEVVPEVVHEGENLSVAYGNIVGVLIEAVKELSAQVKKLEAK
jgi:hypothetical protein